MGRFVGLGGGNQDDDAPGEDQRLRSLDDVETDEYLRHEGRVREVHADRIVLADMIYSVNWLPLGGFVRLSGENNPAAPQSLARRSVGQRAIVLAGRFGHERAVPHHCFANHGHGSPHGTHRRHGADYRGCARLAGRRRPASCPATGCWR